MMTVGQIVALQNRFMAANQRAARRRIDGRDALTIELDAGDAALIGYALGLATWMLAHEPKPRRRAKTKRRTRK